MATNPPGIPEPPRQQEALITRREGTLALGVLALAVLVGIQLGGLQWRYRKQIWQFQGALAGCVVGLVVGYGMGRRQGR